MSRKLLELRIGFITNIGRARNRKKTAQNNSNNNVQIKTEQRRKSIIIIGINSMQSNPNVTRSRCRCVTTLSYALCIHSIPHIIEVKLTRMHFIKRIKSYNYIPYSFGTIP